MNRYENALSDSKNCFAVKESIPQKANYKVSSYKNLAIPSKDTNTISHGTNSIPCISTDTNINSTNCSAVNQTDNTSSTKWKNDGTYHHQVQSIIEEVETTIIKGT